MCTVTIIPWNSGLRLVTSRDERRTRPAGAAPRAVEVGAGVRALWPSDGLAGGTWVGATDRGLVLALLNGHPDRATPPAPTEGLVSRGSIIPALAGSGSAGEAIERLGWMPLERFAPFRLVAASEAGIVDGAWDGHRLVIGRRAMEPACFVSSGLGDRLVRPRLELFDCWLAEHGPTAPAQDAFHRHRWPDRPEISVWMSREDARTVSVTTVELAPGTGPVMHHRDDAGELRLSLADEPEAVRGATAGGPG